MHQNLIDEARQDIVAAILNGQANAFWNPMHPKRIDMEQELTVMPLVQKFLQTINGYTKDYEGMPKSELVKAAMSDLHDGLEKLAGEVADSLIDWRQDEEELDDVVRSVLE